MELKKHNKMLTLEFPELKDKPFFREENCSTKFDQHVVCCEMNTNHMRTAPLFVANKI